MYGGAYTYPRPKPEPVQSGPNVWLREALDAHKSMTIRAKAARRAGYPHAADCFEAVAGEYLRLIEALDKVKG